MLCVFNALCFLPCIGDRRRAHLPRNTAMKARNRFGGRLANRQAFGFTKATGASSSGFFRWPRFPDVAHLAESRCLQDGSSTVAIHLQPLCGTKAALALNIESLSCLCCNKIARPTRRSCSWLCALCWTKLARGRDLCWPFPNARHSASARGMRHLAVSAALARMT